MYKSISEQVQATIKEIIKDSFDAAMDTGEFLWPVVLPPDELDGKGLDFFFSSWKYEIKDDGSVFIDIDCENTLSLEEILFHEIQTNDSINVNDVVGSLEETISTLKEWSNR